MTSDTTKSNSDVKPFMRSDEYDETYKRYVLPTPGVRAKLRAFMSAKRLDPTWRVGDDTPFVSNGPYGKALPGLRHMHLSQDLSIVYRVHNNQVWLYGIYPHKELGTGNASQIRTQQAMADRFKRYKFHE